MQPGDAAQRGRHFISLAPTITASPAFSTCPKRTERGISTCGSAGRSAHPGREGPPASGKTAIRAIAPVSMAPKGTGGRIQHERLDDLPETAPCGHRAELRAALQPCQCPRSRKPEAHCALNTARRDRDRFGHRNAHVPAMGEPVGSGDAAVCGCRFRGQGMVTRSRFHRPQSGQGDAKRPGNRVARIAPDGGFLRAVRFHRKRAESSASQVACRNQASAERVQDTLTNAISAPPQMIWSRSQLPRSRPGSASTQLVHMPIPIRSLCRTQPFPPEFRHRIDDVHSCPGVEIPQRELPQ